MKEAILNEIIPKNLAFLFDDYGFRIYEVRTFPDFGNWVAVLISDSCCRIRLLQDQFDLMVSFGPIWSPPGWEDGPFHDLAVVLEYLGESKKYISNKYTKEDNQLEEISRIVEPFMTKICALFIGNNYEKKKKRLDEIYQRHRDHFFSTGKWD